MKTSREAIILVIEKDDTQKEYICNRLENIGFHRLLCAQTAEEVLDFLESERIPDIILLGEIDDMCIMESARKIKEIKDDIIVIVLANSPTITAPLEAVSLGIEAWIEKGKSNMGDEVVGKIAFWSKFKMESERLQELCEDRRLAHG